MIKVIKNSKSQIIFFLLLITSLTFGQGSRYTGTYKKSGPLQYVDKSDIIIEGLEISNIEDRGISLFGCHNVIIRNCKIKNLKTSVAIYADKGSNILIQDCTFENVHRGVMTSLGKGNIKVENNDFKNILGEIYGGSVVSFAIQFNQCNGAGNSISKNSIENIWGESSPADIINVFASNGTPNSPILVKDNWLRGGGPCVSGGGILLGDWGGSYQIAENNIVVNPGQYGMGIAGGNNIALKNNKIYSKKQSFTNVGLSICNWTPDKTGTSYNIIVENNDVNWTNKDGTQNKSWFENDMRKVILNWSTSTKFNSSLNESILPQVIINRAGNTGSSNPDVNQPTPPESIITQVYIDSFKRIAIKYLVSPIPHAFAEAYTSSGQLLEAMTLPRFNQSFPHSAPKGEYFVKITYRDLGKTEITKITVN